MGYIAGCVATQNDHRSTVILHVYVFMLSSAFYMLISGIGVHNTLSTVFVAFLVQGRGAYGSGA